jgi:hypothetical protein
MHIIHIIYSFFPVALLLCSLMASSGGAPAAAPSSSASATAKRDRVVDELVASERAYVAHLEQCVKVYHATTALSPSAQAGLEISPALVEALFGNMEAIHKYHVVRWSGFSLFRSAFISFEFPFTLGPSCSGCWVCWSQF